MHRLIALLVSLSLAITALPAQAFGLRTHLYIAEQVLIDIDPDCTITVGGVVQTIPKALCDDILQNRGAFFAGAIGPDAFPDLLIGQNYIHPGTPLGRQSADWLEHIAAATRTPADRAFAYGMMVHAAGDIFAHSYVNNYAGGVFELTSKRAKDVELRHFQLEKYIDQRLDYPHPPVADLAVPAGLMVRTMIQTSYVPGAERIGMAELIQAVRTRGRSLGEGVARQYAKAAPAAHAAQMAMILEIAEAGAIRAPCDLVARIDAVARSYRAYLAAESRARAVAGGAAGTPLPPQPIPDEWVPTSCALESDVPAPIARSDRIGSHAQQAAIDTANARLATIAAATGEMQWHDYARDRRKSFWAMLNGGERAALARAYRRYLDAVEARDRAYAVAIFAPHWAADVRLAIESYIGAGVEMARVAVANAAPFPPARHDRGSATLPYRQWKNCWLTVFRGQSADAAAALCGRMAAMRVDMSMTRAAVYSGLGKVPRNLLFEYLAFTRWLNAALTDIALNTGRVVAPNLTGLVEAATDPKRVDRDMLDRLFARADSGQVRFRCVSDWIDVDLGMIDPPSDSGTRVDAECERPGGFDRARRKWLDPEKFVALRHAITLSKLALLDPKGVRDLAGAIAGESASNAVNDIVTGDYPAYSIILDTARSLDGSYQWQGLSMPPPRQNGYSAEQARAIRFGAGYPAHADAEMATGDGAEKRGIRLRPGFPYYRTPLLRSAVFARLFDAPFEGEILRHPAMAFPFYPFSPCVGDPFRPAKDGQNVVRKCVTGTEGAAIRP